MSRIKELREQKNLSQNSLAVLLGVTQGAVHQWESGITKPRANILIKISNIFGCTIDDLFDEERK